MTVRSGVLGGALTLVHLTANRLRFLHVPPRSLWLSAAGGVSVSDVFVHLFPELGRAQEVIRGLVSGPSGYLEHHVHLLSLFGMVVFYGLERSAVVARRLCDLAAGGGSTAAVTVRPACRTVQPCACVVCRPLIRRRQRLGPEVGMEE